jgi:hypothetical protein
MLYYLSEVGVNKYWFLIRIHRNFKKDHQNMRKICPWCNTVCTVNIFLWDSIRFYTEICYWWPTTRVAKICSIVFVGVLILKTRKMGCSHTLMKFIQKPPYLSNIWMAGLTLEGDSGEEVALWRLTSLSHWSKAKFKSPCNFEESPHVAACVFSPLVIYENVDIVHVFIEIYRIRY